MDLPVVRFNSRSERFAEFSNFSNHPIELRGKRWPTAEHFYQAQKFLDPEYEEQIRNAESPKLAKRLGHAEHKKFARTGTR